MPSYYDYTVPVPTGKNLTQKKVGNVVYVYFTYRRQKTKTGNLAPVAHIVGKLVPDTDPPVMYPNLHYYTHFAETTPSAVTNLGHRDNIVLGPYVVFHKIVSDLHLDQILTEVILDTTTAQMILDTAAYEVINEFGTMKYFPDYSTGYMSFTTGMKIISDTTVAKFTRTLDEEVKGKFLALWAKNLERSKNAVIYHDATSTISNRIEKPVNYAIAYDTEIGLPVFYEACYKRDLEISEVIEDVYSLGYGNLENVLDGTNLSRRNIFKYLTGTVNPLVVIRGIRKISAEFGLRARGKFEGKEQYRISGSDLNARTDLVQFYPDQEQQFYFHFFYDEHDATRQKNIIGQTVDQYLIELDQLIGTAREDEVDTKYTAYFKLEFAPEPDSDGVALLTKVERNIPAIQKALDDAGYITVISPAISSAEEIYKCISVLDMKEHLFVWDKPYLGATQVHGSTVEHMEPSNNGRFFVEFIASIIRCGIYRELKKRTHDVSARLYGYTVEDIVKELGSVVATLRSNEKYSLRTSESPLALEILNMFSLNADSITNAIAKLNREIVLSPKVPKPVQNASLDTRVDRICSALDLLAESYGLLTKDATDANADIADIDNRIKAHIHPNWLR